MSYIDRLLDNYLKTFKVNKKFDFVTNQGNELKVTTYKVDAIYYVKFERVYRDGTIHFYQENYANNKNDFKKVVCNVIFYLNNYA